MSDKSGWLLGIFSLVLLTGCGTASLQDRVARLEAETAAIQQQIARPQDSVTLEELFTVHLDRHNMVSTALAKRYLMTIELPQNPTAAQVDAYLDKLYNMNRTLGMSRFGMPGAQMDDGYEALFCTKVTAVGEENLPKLIGYLNHPSFSRAFVILGGGARKDLLLRTLQQSRGQGALINLYIERVEPADIEEVLGMLIRHPGLIEAVKKLRIEQQALPIIKEKLRESTSGRSLSGYESQWLKVALETMPPAEAAAFVEEYWKKNNRSSPRNDDYNLMQQALVLAARGYLPAFQYLGNNFIYNQNGEIRQSTLGLADCKPDEFPVWYAQNRDQLVFDAATGRFRAPVKP